MNEQVYRLDFSRNYTVLRYNTTQSSCQQWSN